MNIYKSGVKKEVDAMYFLTEQGIDWKEVDQSLIAPDEGLPDTLFYEKTPDWVLKTDEICKSTYSEILLGYLDYRAHAGVNAGKTIRPEIINMDITAKKGTTGGDNSTLRCTCYHSIDGVNWTALPYINKTISTDDYYPYSYVFNIDEDIDVRYIKFELQHRSSSGALIRIYSSTGKCSRWWEEG